MPFSEDMDPAPGSDKSSLSSEMDSEADDFSGALQFLETRKRVPGLRKMQCKNVRNANSTCVAFIGNEIVCDLYGTSSYLDGNL